MVPIVMSVKAYIGLKNKMHAALYELGPSMRVPLIPSIFSSAGLMIKADEEPVTPNTIKAITPSLMLLVHAGRSDVVHFQNFAPCPVPEVLLRNRREVLEMKGKTLRLRLDS
jgi:hypothetical protein